MNAGILGWFEEWYADQKSHAGDGPRFMIGTLDNPGYSMRIYLKRTPLENAATFTKEMDEGDDNWYTCGMTTWHKSTRLFTGASSQQHLSTMLEIFKNSVTGTSEDAKEDDILVWLERWCIAEYERLSEDDRHEIGPIGFEVTSSSEPKYTVRLFVSDSSIDGKPFEKISIHDGPDDWYTCELKTPAVYDGFPGKYQIFEGEGSLRRLTTILRCFKKYVES